MKLWIVLILTILIISCNKDDNNTKLELTVLDEHGSPARDFDVDLFGNVDDWKNRFPFLQTAKTNENGVVTFDNLNSIKYYFKAFKGCINNNLSYVSIEPLKTDYINTLTIRVQETCHFTITNNSGDNYRVYYDGIPQYTIPGHSYQTFVNGFPTGITKVRTLQLDGYIFFATDLTFTIDAECNSVESVVIP